MMESRIFEESFLEPMVDWMVDANRQFMTSDREVFILGENAITDPVTGEQIPVTTRESISGWDLVPNYEAHAVGATTQLNRTQRQQNLTFLMQAMGSNPMMASAINWIPFMRQLCREFELENVNELVATPAQMQAMMAAQQGGGQAPEDQGSEVPGTPNQVGTYLPTYAGQGVAA
jgi:hypothetical protein